MHFLRVLIVVHVRVYLDKKDSVDNVKRHLVGDKSPVVRAQ